MPRALCQGSCEMHIECVYVKPSLVHQSGAVPGTNKEIASGHVQTASDAVRCVSERWHTLMQSWMGRYHHYPSPSAIIAMLNASQSWARPYWRFLEPAAAMVAAAVVVQPPWFRLLLSMLNVQTTTGVPRNCRCLPQTYTHVG